MQGFRHGVEQHLHDGLGWSDVVLQQPLPGHAEGAVAVEPQAVLGLGVESIDALLFFGQI